MAEFLQHFQGNRPSFPEAADAGAPQHRDVAAGAKRVRQVPHQGPHIGPFAADDLDLQVVRIRRAQHPRLVDGHRPRLQLHLDPLPRQVVGPLAVHLDGRIDRRGLLDLADEGLQRLCRRLRRGPHVRFSRDHALAVEAGGGLAPGDGEAIGLVRLHQERDGLGRLAKRDGQDASGQRIQGPGVARLLSLEQAAHLGDRLGGGHVEGLVERDPSRDRPPLAPPAH